MLSRRNVSTTNHIKVSEHLAPSSSQGNAIHGTNYDYLSDQHNLIIGSIVLFLTLAGMVIAYLTLRQGRHPRRTQSTSMNTNVPTDIELGSLDRTDTGATTIVGPAGQSPSNSQLNNPDSIDVIPKDPVPLHVGATSMIELAKINTPTDDT